jgi:ATP-dependent DNA helicase DinG
VNVSIVIPKDEVPQGIENIRAWVLDIAAKAAQNGLKPISFGKAPVNHNIKTYLNQATMAGLSARPEGMSMSEYIAGLVNAWLRHESATLKQHVESATASSALGAGLRPEQKRLIQYTEEGLTDGKIVFSEAGTGVGKSRAELTMAARYAARTGRPAAIAVPTLVVLAQTVGEYDELQPGDMGLERKPRLGFVIGRGNFVDPTKLADILDDPDDLEGRDLDKASAWLNAGGPGSPASKTVNLHKALPGMAWLVDDLQHAAPAFPADEVRMAEDSPEECPAKAIYLRLRDEVLTAKVVICTHTMLGLSAMHRMRSVEELRRRIEALDIQIEQATLKEKPATVERLQRQRKRAAALLAERESDEDISASEPILPEYGALFIDEAHQFEANIANLRSSDVNPRLLAQQVEKLMPEFVACRKKVAAEKLAGVLGQIHDKAILAGKFSKEDRVRVNGPADIVNQAVADVITPFFIQIRDEIKIANLTRKCPTARSALNPLAVVTRNIQTHGDGVWLNFSPRRRYPSLHTGPRSVKTLMERIWDQVECAALLSATLALPDAAGLPRVGFMTTEMAVPAHRILVTPPITQPWLYVPTLHCIGRGRDDLRAPRDMSDEGEGVNVDAVQWADRIAHEILAVAESAKGGTLVLTTSYDRIKLLAKALHDLKGRLVVQSRKRGVRSAQVDFISKNGTRPIWLATGPAWTGLDLREEGVDAKDDFLLTDLVIANLPFGTNRSTTHAARMEWQRTAERDRAALEFKQGIGRLVRREGVTERRIHILDPRVWVLQPYYAPFRKIIEPYQTSA